MDTLERICKRAFEMEQRRILDNIHALYGQVSEKFLMITIAIIPEERIEQILSARSLLLQIPSLCVTIENADIKDLLLYKFYKCTHKLNLYMKTYGINDF